MIATQQQANVITLGQTQPMARYIVLDLETGQPGEDVIQAAVQAWKPPGNIRKPETIAERKAEAEEKIRNKGALLDAAPILCAGFKTDTAAVMFSSMGDPGELDVPGWRVVNLASEREMLTEISAWLNSVAGAETVLGGHNIQGFDAPKLRNAFVRHRLPLPQCLRPLEPFQPMWDTMKKFRFYSSQHSDELFVSLDVVSDAFGIPKPKQFVHGSEVPGMHAAGRFAEILVYCCIDIETTEQIYLAMTA
jgi:hypothetical protein